MSMEKKSKYYYDFDRNLDNAKQMSWKDEVIKDKDKKWQGGKINPKMMMSKEELGIPEYYIGKRYKYEARKVVEDWNLSYNTGTAVSYILRAGKKTEAGMSSKDKHIEDIEKAINHLQFELDRIKND